MVLHRADREVQGSRHLRVRVTVREEVRDTQRFKRDGEEGARGAESGTGPTCP